MPEVLNRVDNELTAWREREERFEKRFPGTLQDNMPFLKEKLEFLDSLQAKYGRSTNVEERLMLSILKQDRNDLANTVYPSFLGKLFRRILLPFTQKQREEIATQNITGNVRLLRDTLDKVGFTQVGNQLEQYIDQGLRSFSIPVSYYVNQNERMDFNLSFIRDHSGQYQLEGYTGSLNNGSQPEVSRQQYFSIARDGYITAEQCTHLLAGRAIRITGNGLEGQYPGWLQLDFNDMDAAGNFKTKQFPITQDFNLRELIQQLPLQEKLPHEALENIVISLENGRQQAITVLIDDKAHKYLIEANPQYRSLNIYDGNKLVKLHKEVNQTSESQRHKMNIVQGMSKPRQKNRKVRPGIS